MSSDNVIIFVKDNFKYLNFHFTSTKYKSYYLIRCKIVIQYINYAMDNKQEKRSISHPTLLLF